MVSLIPPKYVAAPSCKASHFSEASLLICSHFSEASWAIEQPSLGVGHHALELGAVGVGARLREVAVRGHHAQIVLGAVGAGLLHLYLYGLAALVVAREAGVYRRAPAHGYSISSAAWNHTTVPITRTGPSSMPKIMSS